jgi:hypothetical protein
MRVWERIREGLETGFDATIAAVHSITEKAEEGIELTRLRREKARYEAQVEKLLTELGSAVYEKISKGSFDEVANQLSIKEKISEISEKQTRIDEINRKLGKELVADRCN